MRTLLILLAMGTTCLSADPQEPANELARAARVRQEKLKHFQCITKVNLLKIKNPSVGLEGNDEPVLMQVTGDLSSESHTNLKVSENLIYVHDDQPMLRLWDGKIIKFSQTSCYNGDMIKNIVDMENASGQSDPQAAIQPGNHIRITSSSTCAIVLSARGDDPQTRWYDLSEFSPTKNQKTIHGKVCREYTHQEPYESMTTIWVDPNMNHSIVRIESTNQGAIRTRYDIDYRHDDSLNDWLPSQWTFLHFDHKAMIDMQMKVAVEKFDHQTEIRKQDIDFEFPAGMRIADNRVRKTYRMGNDGTMLQVIEDYQPGSTDEIKPPTGFLQNNFGLVTTFFFFSILLLVVVFRSKIMNRISSQSR